MPGSTRENAPTQRRIYGPWPRGFESKTDPGFLNDNLLSDIVNFDVTKEGTLVPRRSFQVLQREDGVNDNVLKGCRVLGYITSSPTFSDNGKVIVLKKDAETGNQFVYAGNPVTTTGHADWSTPLSITGAGVSAYTYAFLDYAGVSYYLSTQNNQSVRTAFPLSGATSIVTNIPGGHIAFLWKDRMWVINGYRVYYSKVTDPTIWAAPDGGFFDVLDTGEPITCYAIRGDVLYLFKSNSSYTFNYSSDPADGYLRTVNQTQGAEYAVITNSVIYTADRNSVYVYTNGYYNVLSSNIENVDGLYIYGLMFDETYNRLLVYRPEPNGNSDVNGKFYNMNLLVYDIFNQSWTRYYLPSTDYIQNVINTAGTQQTYKMPLSWNAHANLIFSAGNQLIALGTTSQIYDGVVDDDNAANRYQFVYFKVSTKTFTFDDVFSIKQLKRLKVAAKDTGTNNVTFSTTVYSLEGNTDTVFASQEILSRINGNVPLLQKYRGNAFRFSFEWGTTARAYYVGANLTHPAYTDTAVSFPQRAPSVRQILIDVEAHIDGRGGPPVP